MRTIGIMTVYMENKVTNSFRITKFICIARFSKIQKSRVGYVISVRGNLNLFQRN